MMETHSEQFLAGPTSIWLTAGTMRAAAISSASCSSLKLDTPMARHSPEAGCPGTLVSYISGQHVTWRPYFSRPTSYTTC